MQTRVVTKLNIINTLIHKHKIKITSTGQKRAEKQEDDERTVNGIRRVYTHTNNVINKNVQKESTRKQNQNKKISTHKKYREKNTNTIMVHSV